MSQNLHFGICKHRNEQQEFLIIVYAHSSENFRLDKVLPGLGKLLFSIMKKSNIKKCPLILLF